MAKTNVRQGAIKASQAAIAARSNPYIQRLLTDDELRRNVIDAFGAIRESYRRMSNGKGPARALAEDKKVQQNLRLAADSLRAASEQLKSKPKRKKRKRGLGRLILLTLVSGGVVLALSEGARKALLDLVFGSEEEFEYSSTTSNSGS